MLQPVGFNELALFPMSALEKAVKQKRGGKLLTKWMALAPARPDVFWDLYTENGVDRGIIRAWKRLP